MPLKVSVIATVKNEEHSIHRLLDSLVAQTRQPDEVIIVDGGSTDGTLRVLEKYVAQGVLPLRVLVRPGTNIAAGRNAAIEAATHNLIACTDAGVRLSPNWLADLIRPFEENSAVPVVGGFFLPDPQTLFETALGATTLPALVDVNPGHFLPSSRSVAYRRETWERVGRYPEWLDYCEDLVFDLRLYELFDSFPFVAQAVAYFRPRSNLRAFFRQYYHYARGDGKADTWRKRHLIRYLTYLVVLPLLFYLTVGYSPWWVAVLLAGAVFVLRRPYQRLRPMLARYGLVDRIRAVLWVPIIIVTGDVAKMLGYPVGVWYRWRHRLPSRHLPTRQ
ncbi:MAG: glycosyltransferase [Anaerolineae bacterium]|jgi:glycosyltransferase involved in cell wall biosynthesis|nr:glycosyltransferase [Anaerolineae bacterium]MDH7475640.1 glycosyltransferase [Anaerolineae bacterium]